MRRFITTALAAAAAVTLLASPFAGPAIAAPAEAAVPAVPTEVAVPAEDATTTPVVFVHGRNAPPAVWGTMEAAFEAQGYPAGRLFAFDYDTSQSTNETVAGQLSAYVDQVLRQSGAGQVDIVAHSLGSLSARWYAKFGAGGGKVRNLVTLGGPNHGTDLAWACSLWDQGCRDMTPGSYVVSHLDDGSETPAPVRYFAFWSPCDEQILPNASAELDGAADVRTGCLKHNALLTDPTVAAEVIAALTDAPAAGAHTPGSGAHDG